MKLFNKGDKVGIVACSNGLTESNVIKLEELKNILETLGLQVAFGNKIYRKYSVFNGTGKEKAEALMKFFLDPSIKAIFDVSGGDLANGILDYLDYEAIKANPKAFFGYSDLSVVLNGIYSKTGVKTYLYQIRNLIEEFKLKQIEEFNDTFIEDGNKLLNFNYEWIQGNFIEGTVVGGNIRCLLKLAGTEYIPDFTDKIIFLESLSGDVPKMVTYLTQCKQIGMFRKAKGIILGSFTEMEKEEYLPTIVEIVKEIVNNPNIPIVKTNEIGHGKDSKCIIIGELIKIYTPKKSSYATNKNI
ncbi:S66 peptidase family protein [Clostridium sp. C2-6-12]|uniref:S66 family peptidase n=1 Tax=Clostridium sp. C2-6-12 TaxID=2698832 RepID=UPI00136CA3EC|nr:S66 peptidase family protein [Clostridium sp. C2-6-12]